MTHTHTPGPWDQIGCDIYSGEIKIARFIDIPWERMLENEANMNLISSAPDLLEALQVLMHATRKGKKPAQREEARATARAAIAKATGKEEA